MRILAITALSVAFLATVSGKIDFNPCRKDVPRATFDEVFENQDGLPQRHFVIGLDRGL
jgi:hypothetical protein